MFAGGGEQAAVGQARDLLGGQVRGMATGGGAMHQASGVSGSRSRCRPGPARRWSGGEERLRPGPEGGGGLLLLVRVDLAVGQAGVVLDGRCVGSCSRRVSVSCGPHGSRGPCGRRRRGMLPSFLMSTCTGDQSQQARDPFRSQAAQYAGLDDPLLRAGRGPAGAVVGAAGAAPVYQRRSLPIAQRPALARASIELAGTFCCHPPG